MKQLIIEELKKELKLRSYEHLNLRKNPFLPYLPQDSEIIELFSGRETEIKDTIRYISDLLNGDLQSVVILGTKGIGKTHFLRFIYLQLKELEKEIEYKAILIDSFDFIDFYRNVILNPTSEPHIIFIDNTEDIWQKYKQEFLSIFTNSGNKFKIICAWNYAAWMKIKRDKFNIHMKDVRILLNELSEKELIDILKKRINKVKLGETPFTDDALKLIAVYSRGVPFSAIYLAERCISFALNKQLKKISTEIVNEVSDMLGFIRNDLCKLTETQTAILKELWVLSSSEKRGISADELKDKIGVSRSAIVQHLLKLGEKKILSKKREEKKVLYYISPTLLQPIEKYLSSIDVEI